MKKYETPILERENMTDIMTTSGEVNIFADIADTDHTNSSSYIDLFNE